MCQGRPGGGTRSSSSSSAGTGKSASLQGGDLLGKSGEKGLGTVDLTTGKISTQYEEEGSSKFDSEDSSESVSTSSSEPLSILSAIIYTAGSLQK